MSNLLWGNISYTRARRAALDIFCLPYQYLDAKPAHAITVLNGATIFIHDKNLTKSLKTVSTSVTKQPVCCVLNSVDSLNSDCHEEVLTVAPCQLNDRAVG